ncbi:hypothetical protein POM88_042054 [Heracleum sosnowskyi]|uniref:Reverse transcriptase Ty1/copia-type domain-containing protein n=1 Tax=Heracleum sosnowskyi TaxID=360622 RepID=A0AAD8HHT4_9APIA|nr:hypothetical protein POM88_042054 [Heracleum sosnowskyi]
MYDFVYKMFKALYGLKQAPRAWYDTLSAFLLENQFTRGVVDKTLFYKHHGKDIILVQIYVDDIIFGSSNEKLCEKFSSLMRNNLDLDSKGKKLDSSAYRGMVGSLLYLTSSRPDIMFATCLCARFQADPKESQLIAIKRIFRYLKGTPNLGLWYPKNTGFELVGYSDSDYAGCRIDRKSTTGSCQFLGGRLVSWFSKKQHSVSTSTAEAEYIAAGSCCAQILWMKNQRLDYGLVLNNIPIYCDNTSAIAISDNPVQHSRTKHIDIRHHFIREHVERGTVKLIYVPTEKQLADIFTKPLDEATFNRLVSELGMLNLLFLNIGYSGPILEEGTTKWYPSNAMVKVFSTKTTGWNGIPTYIKKLTHSLVHGYKVDVGKLLMAYLKAAVGKKVNIYPRFLMLCINSLCDFDENAPRLEVCPVLKRNTHTTLTSQNLNAHIPLCFTKHMVDQVTDLDFPLPSGFDTFTTENEAGLDPNSANPHSTPYIQPRFSRLPKVHRL